jgi:hypothetical protein
MHFSMRRKLTARDGRPVTPLAAAPMSDDIS